ncbi:protein adenylyltransferase SelO [Jiella marina]|uniref:protein adenylyltransferase SelO n=1 Tax=Jiella sp. LLJ827 TaxID=2917712 RepID=UPI002101068F|nr:YdiU family protein [Jiella sp. LLJ827]MCQ0986076.1 YdiU family protein [Jiella sp. LLJ827]
MTIHFPFDNTYARLGEAFHRPTMPTPVDAPMLLKLNRSLCEELGLDADALDTPEGAEILSGNRIPTGADPIAAAYAGHQFGHFVPQLGDGRAILVGEVLDRNGRRRDIQLKGSGPTAFSRSGDGRAALGPVLREYLVSEAMAALGIPTTRALAAVATGEPVFRETPLPGSILARVASSHVRVGTFQFFAARGDAAAIGRLADHVIERHYPEAASVSDRYRALLEGVSMRQAALVARWMQVGFVHGVMNTDNMSIAGETIDYGPCAFLDSYDPRTVFSSIDRQGRYAYGNQPAIASWNLARFAECLLPLLDPKEEKAIEIAQDVLAGFAGAFEAAYVDGFRAKLGPRTAQDDDAGLISDLLEVMAREKADFTATFRRLGQAAESSQADGSLQALFDDPTAYDRWAVRWRERLAAEPLDPGQRRTAMDAVNPAIIPRNHRVEEALAAALTGDMAPFERLNEALAKPFDDTPELAEYASLPPEPETPYRTFCGT